MQIILRKDINKIAVMAILFLFIAAAYFHFLFAVQMGNYGSAYQSNQQIVSSSSIPQGTPVPASAEQTPGIPAIDENSPLLAAKTAVAPEAAPAVLSSETEIARGASSTVSTSSGNQGLPSASSGNQNGRAVTSPSSSPNSLLSSPYVYYLVFVILALMLLLNVFRISFGSPAIAYEPSVFRTLSSETRVEMLTSLKERRKTLTQLAEETGISLPGAKQHLGILEEAGLIRKIDEGRKWKYYELTEEGRNILATKYS